MWFLSIWFTGSPIYLVAFSIKNAWKLLASWNFQWNHCVLCWIAPLLLSSCHTTVAGVLPFRVISSCLVAWQSSSCGSIPLFLVKSWFFPFFCWLKTSTPCHIGLDFFKWIQKRGVDFCQHQQSHASSRLGVSWHGGYPSIINFNKIFHYKPSILSYHHLWKPPFQVMIFGPSPGWFVATSRFCQQFAEPLGGPWSALRGQMVTGGFNWFNWFNHEKWGFHQPKCIGIWSTKNVIWVCPNLGLSKNEGICSKLTWYIC